MRHKSLLYSIFFIFLSYLVSTLSLVHFSPWTFLAQITLGLVLGALGFILLIVFLISRIFQKATL